MIGAEALALQGIPVKDLLLSKETSRQLQDFAGNAMSSTVIGAAVLSALILAYPILPAGNGTVNDGTNLVSHRSIASPDDSKQGMKSHLFTVSRFREHNTLSVGAILDKAFASQRMCLCEGATLRKAGILKCSECSFTACKSCAGKPLHTYVEYPYEDLREMPQVFERFVTAFLPMRIKFSPNTCAEISKLHSQHVQSYKNRVPGDYMQRVKEAIDQEFCYQAVQRKAQWIVTYDSRAASLQLTLRPESAEWRLYVRPKPTDPGNHYVRKMFALPVLRMKPRDELLNGLWQVCLPIEKSFAITIKGSGDQLPSWESRLGLMEDRFINAKVRTNLVIDVKTTDLQLCDLNIAGSYRLLRQCGTASGSLYKRINLSKIGSSSHDKGVSLQGRSIDQPIVVDGTSDEPGDLDMRSTSDDESSEAAGETVYLFLDPERIGDPKHDSFVFATNKHRLAYDESRPIIAVLDSAWRPADNLGIRKVKCKLPGQWLSLENASLELYEAPREAESSYSVAQRQNISPHAQADCAQAYITLLDCSVALSPGSDRDWPKDNWKEVLTEDKAAFFLAHRWLTEGIPMFETFREWKRMDILRPLARCESCAPSRPRIKWMVKEEVVYKVLNADQVKTARAKGMIDDPAAVDSEEQAFIKFRGHRQIKKYTGPGEDPRDAGKYERRLKMRPAVFVVFKCGDGQGLGRLQFRLNFVTLAHQALAELGAPSGVDVSVHWRLTSTLDTTDTSVEPLRVPNNRKDQEFPQPANFKKAPLRKEQLRSLAWMVSQEAEDSEPFEHEEVVEAILPEMKWRLEAKATFRKKVLGGILADDVGYGKTATTLALIDVQRSNRLQTAELEGAISIKATLIVVPKHLLKQWSEQVSKFVQSRPAPIVLSLETEKILAKTTIKMIREADIILVSQQMFEDSSYWHRLAQFAAMPAAPGIKATATGKGTMKYGRPLKAWYDLALTRIATHVASMELFDAAEDVDLFLLEQLQEVLETDTFIDIVPSVHLEAEAAANKTLSNRKGKGKASDVPNPNQPAKKSELLQDAFGLRGKKKAWADVMRGPILHMFKFDRVVVDEFTYVSDIGKLAITTLQTDRRWGLSGTPPLQNFAAVNGMASYLGVKLGMEDNTGSVAKRAERTEYTAAEDFANYYVPRSEAWHQRRHGVAQAFLDHFVRKNATENLEIQTHYHIKGVFLTGAERAIYLEQRQQILSQRLKIVKGPKGMGSNDQAKRLSQLFAGCKVPQQALHKACTFYGLVGHDQPQNGADKACKLIEDARSQEFAAARKNLCKLVNHAVYLARSCKERYPQDDAQFPETHFAGFEREARKTGFGDLSMKTEIDTALNAAQRSYSEKDGARYYQTEPERQAASAAFTKAKKGAKPSPPLPLYPKDFKQYRSALRGLTGQIWEVFNELVSRKRAQRFFKAVRELQEWQSGGQISLAPRCDSCSANVNDPTTVYVLTKCGHVLCEADYAVAQNKKCASPLCDADVLGHTVIRASDLHSEGSVDTTYGTKLSEVCEVLKKQIPKDCQVLLFVQFSDMMDRVCAALTESDISHYKIDGKVDRGLEPFRKENKSTLKKKVLVLEPSSVVASGL